MPSYRNRKYAEDIVRTIKSSDEKFRHDNMTREKCPQCGKYLLEVKGKKEKMLSARIGNVAIEKDYHDNKC